MKALVYHAPRELVWEDFAAPTPTANEEIVSVVASGICGSDMHAYLGHDPRRPPPLILGHEAAVILDNGNTGMVNPLAVCGECVHCKNERDNLCLQRQIISMPPRHGAFAEQLRIPNRNIIPLPPTLSPTQGALCEPLSCGYHAAKLAQQQTVAPLSEMQAVIIGGGAIGLAAALSLSAMGVMNIQIAEANVLRHDILKKSGDFIVAPPDKIKPASVVIDAVGSASSRKLASTITESGGIVVHIGLADNDGGIDIRRATLQEITWQGAYTYTAEDFIQTAKWMGEGKLGALDWYEERPMQEGAQAFADLLNGKVASPKIILIPE